MAKQQKYTIPQKLDNEIASDYHRPSLAAYYDEDFE